MKSFCRKLIRKLRSKLNQFSVKAAKLRVHTLWPVCSRIKGWHGTSDIDYGRQLIISLTSFPARIKTVHITIRSLLMQNMKPNKIILWLASDEFPNGEQELPQELLELQKFGLAICWCENLRSFKKLIPTLKAYPDADIVTADDDLYYRRNWLSSLYAEHMRHPEDVCAHRITKFWLDDAGGGGGGVQNHSRGLRHLSLSVVPAQAHRLWRRSLPCSLSA